MTGFLDEYEDVIMDRGRVRRHYIGSWFMLDLPASLPYIFVNRYMPEKTPLGVFIMCGCSGAPCALPTCCLMLLLVACADEHGSF